MAYTFNELNKMARRGTPFQRRMAKPDTNYRNVWEIKTPPKKVRYTIYFETHTVDGCIAERMYVVNTSKQGAEEKAMQILLKSNTDVHPSRVVLVGSRESDDMESFFKDYF